MVAVHRLIAPLLSLALLGGCWVSRRVHPRSAEELRRGYAHLARGDPERAEVAFSHALEFDPDLVEGENGLGVVARWRGDLPTALDRFARALALDGGFAEGHANRGEALLSAGDPVAAEGALRAALRLNPDLAAARLNLARSLLRRGLAERTGREPLWREARRALLHLLETDARLPAAHADLALLDFLSGRLEEAEAGWARAAQLDPGDAGAAQGLCLVRAGLGRCAEAAASCARCVALAPVDSRCASTLAEVAPCAAVSGGVSGRGPAPAKGRAAP